MRFVGPATNAAIGSLRPAWCDVFPHVSRLQADRLNTRQPKSIEQPSSSVN
jgi:hypothetical protein